MKTRSDHCHVCDLFLLDLWAGNRLLLDFGRAWLILLALVLMVCDFGFARGRGSRSNEGSPPESAATDTSEEPSLAQPEKAEIDASAIIDRPDAQKRQSNESGEDILKKMVETNRYWFDGPPERVTGYRYAFVHRDGTRQKFAVDDPKSAGAWIKRGITYTPLVAVLAKALSDPNTGGATVESVKKTDKQIRIKFRTNGSLGARLGTGVSGQWHGYVYYRLGSGTLVLNAKTYAPLELTSVFHDEGRDKEAIVTERPSEFITVDSDHLVPLRIEVVRREKEFEDGELENESTYRFDWTFRVYEPGLWLFDGEPVGDETAIGCHLEDVVVGPNKEAKVQAESKVAEAIRENAKGLQATVRQYILANRAWLRPDVKARRGLVYDYTQEDGYRERVVFDTKGNILVQLESGRQSKETSTSRSLELFSADGRVANGTVDDAYLMARPARAGSPIPFTRRKTINNLAVGWGWECASMHLAIAPDDFGVRAETLSDGGLQKITLIPVRNRPTLHLGTMLRFVSWAYLHHQSFARCELQIDPEANLLIEETYFRDDETEPFCVIRFDDWFDTSEGKAPGSVRGHVRYQKKGERDPQTRERKYFEEVFRFTGAFRVTDAGIVLLDTVTSTFESTGNSSTGRVTLVDTTEKSHAPIRSALERLAATDQLLTRIEQAPRGRNVQVPCRWGQTIPVWLNGKYQHALVGQGKDGREPPYHAYLQNIGIRDVRPEVLSDGQIRATVNLYSTAYYEGYDFEVTLRLLDDNGTCLGQETLPGKTRTMGQPEKTLMVVDFNSKVDVDRAASLRLTLDIKRLWGSHYYRGMWMRSSFSSNSVQLPYLPGARDWGPEQAIGEPGGSHRIGGDYKRAWSSLTEDDQQEWLELTYGRRIQAVGVNVYETFNPGAVCKVSYFDAAGSEVTVWEGDDPTPPIVEPGKGTSKIRFNEPVETNRVRVYLDSPKVTGWNEIDAVGLVEATADGSDGREHWAKDATASSTFANEPRPDTLVYRYDGAHKELKYDDGYRDWMRSLGGGTWQVLRFHRPKDTPYVDAVRVLASHYGSRSREKTHLYLLDEKMNVLSDLASELRMRTWGMKWYLFHVPSVEVPETFHVAFKLNSHQRGGVYVATRELNEGEECQSFSYNEESGLKPLEVQGAHYDWMIRAYMAHQPDEEAREKARAQQREEETRLAYQKKGSAWGPEQATGKPDTYEDYASGGDWRTAWASKTADAQPEWLELTYTNRIQAIGVDIYETFNPGAVNKVTSFDSRGEEAIIWEGTDPTQPDVAEAKGVSKIRFAKPVEANRVRIYVDSPRIKGWNEIDAVGLIEVGSNVHWATGAKTSSTYAK